MKTFQGVVYQAAGAGGTYIPPDNTVLLYTGTKAVCDLMAEVIARYEAESGNGNAGHRVASVTYQADAALAVHDQLAVGAVDYVLA